MQKHAIVVSALCYLVIAEPPVQAVKPNIIGSSEQHTSFSFIRPGLTQTSFAFNGPSSHQSFASSIGNPQLAQKVLPSLAHALAYRNPGLGLYLKTIDLFYYDDNIILYKRYTKDIYNVYILKSIQIKDGKNKRKIIF